VDFKNTIIIMTSNIGTRDLKKSGGFGFGTDTAKHTAEGIKTTIEDALKRVFNPEFLNRLDDTIIFHSLEKEHIMQIVDIQMRDLLKRVTTMGITIELTKPAKEFLADQGYDPAYGARPLRRALQKYLEDPVAEELLKGKYPEGTVIRAKVDKKNDQLKFSIVTAGQPEAPEEEEEKQADVS
jgi:ATP-dependent Clp protease ATP-binding subunit ClpC